MKLLKKQIILLSFLSCTTLMGCVTDQKYRYIVSLNMANSTQKSLSGTLFGDRNPWEVSFDLEPGENFELITRDVGNGSVQTPPSGHDVSYIRAFHITSIDNEEADIIIDTTPDGEWERTSYKSTAIYTFSITEDHLKP